MNNLLENISVEQVGAVVVAVISVTKGFTTKFRINDGKQKELITFAFSIFGFSWLIFKGDLVVDLTTLFIIIYFGSSGIYNFIPSVNKSKETETGEE